MLFLSYLAVFGQCWGKIRSVKAKNGIFISENREKAYFLLFKSENLSYFIYQNLESHRIVIISNRSDLEAPEHEVGGNLVVFSGYQGWGQAKNKSDQGVHSTRDEKAHFSLISFCAVAK